LRRRWLQQNACDGAPAPVGRASWSGGVAVDLERTADAIEQLHGVHAIAAGRVGVGDRRRRRPTAGHFARVPTCSRSWSRLRGRARASASRCRTVFGNALSSPTRRSCSGYSSAAAAPTQCANDERSILTPERARIGAALIMFRTRSLTQCHLVGPAEQRGGRARATLAEDRQEGSAPVSTAD
jgi:hypothetical protein